MSRLFCCPYCGAESKLRRADVGRHGPCWQCGHEVTILPPGCFDPPPPWWAVGWRGAALAGSAMLLIHGGLHALPEWAVYRDLGTQTFSQLAAIVGAWLMWGLLAAVCGGAAPALIASRAAYASSYRFVLRASLVAAAVVGVVGGASAAHRLWTESPGLDRLMFWQLVAAGAAAGLVAGAAVGGLVAAPVAAARVQRLRDSIVVDATAPGFESRADTSAPLDAELL